MSLAETIRRGRPLRLLSALGSAFVAAPRSTVIQPGPIHGGLTSDPAAQLGALVQTLVLA
ncbi:MAG: DUF3037 domain-containing protein [Propionibacteriales bacterium]|nr:DUF3037 domain-containing protein [Propionibacteriales bacterium]